MDGFYNLGIMKEYTKTLLNIREDTTINCNKKMKIFLSGPLDTPIAISSCLRFFQLLREFNVVGF